MKLFPQKYALMVLAGVLLVLMVIMALSLSQKPRLTPLTYEQEIQQIETQSENDNLDSIEKDLNNTELNNLDKELQDINSELNSQ